MHCADVPDDVHWGGWERSFYHQKVNELLREEILHGMSPSNCAELRPLGLSMLAELIHHVRMKLSFTQLVEITHKFAGCVALDECLNHHFAKSYAYARV